MKIIITLLLVFTGSVAMAHDGAVSADGCHTQGDNFHCHSAGKTEAINETEAINGTSLRKERGKGFSFETFVGFDLFTLDATEIETDYSVEEDDEYGYTTSYGLSLEYHIDETHSVGIDYYELSKLSSSLLFPITFSTGYTGKEDVSVTLSHKAVGPTYRYYFPFGLYLGLSYFSIDSEVVIGSLISDGGRVPSVSATERNNKFAPSIGYKHVFKNGFILGSRLLHIPTIIGGTDSDVSSLGFTMGYDFR